jgi:hypothetical protein
MPASDLLVAVGLTCPPYAPDLLPPSGREWVALGVVAFVPDSYRMPWSAACITNTFESEFSVHTGCAPTQGRKDEGRCRHKASRPHIAPPRHGRVAARGARAAAMPVVGSSTERYPPRAEYTRSPASRGARPGPYCNALQQFLRGSTSNQRFLAPPTAGTSVIQIAFFRVRRHQIGSPSKR